MNFKPVWTVSTLTCLLSALFTTGCSTALKISPTPAISVADCPQPAKLPYSGSASLPSGSFTAKWQALENKQQQTLTP